MNTESRTNRARPNGEAAILNVYPLAWAQSSIKQKGFIRTSRIAVSVAHDLLFDLRYGTDTMRWVGVESLDTDSENKSYAVQYQATKAQPFLALLRQLNLP